MVKEGGGLRIKDLYILNQILVSGSLKNSRLTQGEERAGTAPKDMNGGLLLCDRSHIPSLKEEDEDSSEEETKEQLKERT